MASASNSAIRHWSQKVSQNILPLSVGKTLPQAFEEWSFTEETVDHEQATEDCELCEQEALRYHFRIRNSLTAHGLWVGSQCILRFGVSVFEHGRRLSAADAKKKLGRLMEKMRLDSCIKALRVLSRMEGGGILENALNYYQQKGYLTPKFAFVVLWRLQSNRIDHSASFFKVSLKRKRYQDDLREMPTSRVHIIWPALTSSQKTMAIELGHIAPTSA